MMRAMTTIAACVIWSAGFVANPVAQGRAADRLAGAKALGCTFSTLASGDWNASGAVGAVKSATLSFRFTDIDTDEGTAVVVGPFGPSDIIVRFAQGTLHLLQSFREGPLYATTIFPHELKPGVLKAVHTRHEYTQVSLPGFTSRPEQYYGDCTIDR